MILSLTKKINMKNLLHNILIIVIVTSYFTATAQIEKTIDLSSNDPVTEPVAHETDINLSIINKLPNNNYVYNIVALIEVQEAEILKFPGENDGLGFAPFHCAIIQDKINVLNATTNESELPKAYEKFNTDIAVIRKEFDKGANASAEAKLCNESSISYAENYVNELKKIKIKKTYRLEKGQKLTVTVSRKTKDGKLKKWTHVYKTRKKVNGLQVLV